MRICCCKDPLLLKLKDDYDYVRLISRLGDADDEAIHVEVGVTVSL